MRGIKFYKSVDGELRESGLEDARQLVTRDGFLLAGREILEREYAGAELVFAGN